MQGRPIHFVHKCINCVYPLPNTQASQARHPWSKSHGSDGQSSYGGTPGRALRPDSPGQVPQARAPNTTGQGVQEIVLCSQCLGFEKYMRDRLPLNLDYPWMTSSFFSSFSTIFSTFGHWTPWTPWMAERPRRWAQIAISLFFLLNT